MMSFIDSYSVTVVPLDMPDSAIQLNGLGGEDRQRGVAKHQLRRSDTPEGNDKRITA